MMTEPVSKQTNVQAPCRSSSDILTRPDQEQGLSEKSKTFDASCGRLPATRWPDRERFHSFLPSPSCQSVGGELRQDLEGDLMEEARLGSDASHGSHRLSSECWMFCETNLSLNIQRKSILEIVQSPRCYLS